MQTNVTSGRRILTKGHIAGVDCSRGQCRPVGCTAVSCSSPAVMPLLVSKAHPCQPSKQHLDWFSRFCTAHPCDQHTDRQTTLRATSVAIRSIYAMHTTQPNNADVKIKCQKIATTTNQVILDNQQQNSQAIWLIINDSHVNTIWRRQKSQELDNSWHYILNKCNAK